MKKHKQCRNPKEKISKLPKKQVVHRKKGQSSFKVQTNNGYKPQKYSKHGRKKPPRCLTAAILEFFFRPQVLASRNKKAWNATVRTSYFSRACVALHTRPPTSALRLPSLARKRRKNNVCFSGY